MMNELCFSGNLKIPFLDTALTLEEQMHGGPASHSLQILTQDVKNLQ
jgi:hypothetical protein